MKNNFLIALIFIALLNACGGSSSGSEESNSTGSGEDNGIVNSSQERNWDDSNWGTLHWQ